MLGCPQGGFTQPLSEGVLGNTGGTETELLGDYKNTLRGSRLSPSSLGNWDFTASKNPHINLFEKGTWDNFRWLISLDQHKLPPEIYLPTWSVAQPCEEQDLGLFLGWFFAGSDLCSPRVISLGGTRLRTATTASPRWQPSLPRTATVHRPSPCSGMASAPSIHVNYQTLELGRV